MKPESFDAWLTAVPKEIIGDSLWKMKAYRLALFAGDLAWYDGQKLLRMKPMANVADQLLRSVGSVGANLAEGYSRGSSKDRARFYEYTLGSSRESRHWYHIGRHVLGESVARHRISLFGEIIRLVLTMITQQRGQTIREAEAVYDASPSGDAARLLTSIPYPG